MSRKNILFGTCAATLVLAIVPLCRGGQSNTLAALSDQVVHRIQIEIRSRYSVPSDVDIVISAPLPSDIPGYDDVNVTFTSPRSGKKTFAFLISKDRKTLAHIEQIDISRDLTSKIDIKGRPSRGSVSGKVEVVVYVDLQDPFSAKLHSTLFPQLIGEFRSDMQVVYKEYPIEELHPWAMHAAVDAECLARENQNAYWGFMDYVLGNQKQVAGDGLQQAFTNLDKAALDQAMRYNVDAERLGACTQSQDTSAIRKSVSEADRLGVDATPTLFINGEKVVGTVPIEKLRVVIQRRLASAR